MKKRAKLIHPLRNGQITIPAEYRAELGIDQHTLLQIGIVGRELRIRPVKVTTDETGSPWLRDLYDLFAEVRKDAEKHSEEEINADIEKAVSAVRRKRVSRRS